MAKITGHKSLMKWLEGREREVAAVIAVRAALRALPIISENWRAEGPTAENTAIVLPLLRTALTSLVWAVSPKGEARTNAAVAAFFAAGDVAAGNVDFTSVTAGTAYGVARGRAARAVWAISNAANAIAAGDNVTGAFKNVAKAIAGAAEAATGVASKTKFYLAVREDCAILEDRVEVKAMLAQRLWHSPEYPEGFELAWRDLQRWFNLDPGGWSFWRDWYQKVLDGQYLSPDLLYDIALLPNSDWNDGPGVIAERIAGLQAKYLSAATPSAEVLYARQETSLIYAVPVPINREQLYATGLQRMKDAFADAQSNNEIGPGSQEARLIRRALYDYAADPQYVHDNLVQARRLIEEQIAKEFLPENGTANNYADTSRTFETDIRAWHPQVEEAVIARGRIRLTEVDPRDLIVVVDLRLPVLVLLESDLAKQTGDDIDDVIDVTPLTDGTVPPRSIETLYRLASRSVRIYKILGDEAIYAGKVGAALAALAAAIRYFAGIFGI